MAKIYILKDKGSKTQPKVCDTQKSAQDGKKVLKSKGSESTIEIHDAVDYVQKLQAQISRRDAIIEDMATENNLLRQALNETLPEEGPREPVLSYCRSHLSGPMPVVSFVPKHLRAPRPSA